MDWNRVQQLYERYLEGETSLAEERELYRLLSKAESLTKEYQAVKAMLDAMGVIAQELCDINIEYQQHESRLMRHTSLRRIASVAAVMLLMIGIGVTAIITAPQSTAEEPMLVCHINGTMVNDQLVAQAEVERILGGVSKNITSAKQRIDDITNRTLNI
jgi:hypothetical protein